MFSLANIVGAPLRSRLSPGLGSPIITHNSLERAAKLIEDRCSPVEQAVLAQTHSNSSTAEIAEQLESSAIAHSPSSVPPSPRIRRDRCHRHHDHGNRRRTPRLL